MTDESASDTSPAGLAGELAALGTITPDGGTAYSFGDAQKLIDLLPRILTALTANASQPRWTKAELEAWCKGWTRTPATVLQAFIDAGFCSDQAPHREQTCLTGSQPDRVVDVLRDALAVADAAPELNMSNYDHDQVDELNAAMIEVHQLLSTLDAKDQSND